MAEYLIESTTSPGGMVLDPMAGSGTTLVAAQKKGRHSVGVERDPLAFLIARSVTQSFDSSCLDSLRIRIAERASEIIRKIRLPELRKKLSQKDQKFLQYWFPSRSQKQLFALAAAIEEETETSQRELAWVVFSSLIIAKSSGDSFALDIPRSRPHKRVEKAIVYPFDGWNRRFKSVMARLPFLDSKPTAGCLIQIGDARSLPIEDGMVDLVLTSPPYLNAIDYLRAHKFSLVWMGYGLETIRELRGTMIGTERGLRSLDGLPSNLEDRLQEVVDESRRQAQLRQYLSDLGRVLREIQRVLRPGGLALFVVGPTIINSRRSDVVDIIGQLGNSIGLQVVGSVARDLSQSRRSLPLPSFSQKTPLAQRMRREVIVALRK